MYIIEGFPNTEVLDDYRSASAEAPSPRRARDCQRGGGCSRRHGWQDGTQVSAARQAAQRGQEHGQELANTSGPLRGGLGRTRSEVAGQRWAGSQDAVCRLAAAFPGPLQRRATADLAAAHQELAGPERAGQRGFLRPGASSGSARCQRLHPLYRAGRDDQRQSVCAHALSFRAHVLQLGSGHALLLGKPGESQRRDAERVVGTGRRAANASHGSADGGGAAGRGRAGVIQATLPGVAESLRLAGPGHSGGQGQRERRRGTEPPPVQAGGGPGADDARQPGIHEPGQLSGIPA
jgi:hypothetical protein